MGGEADWPLTHFLRQIFFINSDKLYCSMYYKRKRKVSWDQSCKKEEEQKDSAMLAAGRHALSEK